MLYVGANRYIPHKRSVTEVFTDRGSFSLERMSDMSEAEVLRKVRETVGDAHWERRIGERLSQLAQR